jgi:hypothetical protein
VSREQQAVPPPGPEKLPAKADPREQILGEWAYANGDKTMEFSEGGGLTIGDSAPDRKSVISARYQFLDDASLQIDVLQVKRETVMLELPPWGTRAMAEALLPGKKTFTIKVRVAFAEGRLSVTSENGKFEYRRKGATAPAGPGGKPEAAADPTGAWKWGLAGQKGSAQEMILRLKLDGGKLTGGIVGRDGRETPVEDAAYRGGEVSFRGIALSDKEFTMKYTGRVSGDTIKGERKVEVNGKTVTFEWEAKRVKD